MKITLAVAMVFAMSLFSFSTPSMAKNSQISDEQIKEKIIQASIAAYSGNCPCPYNSTRNGSQCGKRSAWSRAGGYSPICYKGDVSRKMIDEWRMKNGNK
ncbi:conserved hypothetical protein [Pectobacterium parmentieri WPP163]|uniref:hypothetical protein n=1 Tax=Pectobacterium parmentieri TaxID=1905730 RepID=UPI0001B0B80A|nr:hypothetical protein [Pectobacterium parmentieri]ACX88586.1 conserved hypothetical protein [Pectobacterium parmentieri WPP163]AYH06270.1 hypothetical protein C5E25_13390 [Pectobacterium parmentieri]AYH15089.1 hypothetical protein C5E23_13360 [Pectobacterium parmentieri]AYH23789.1 hypothetical protein C5E21_13350 [Pectobacterium parmentieri]MBI0550412.1 hypothetical protein [Pectobacterium parmentieri]